MRKGFIWLMGSLLLWGCETSGVDGADALADAAAPPDAAHTGDTTGTSDGAVSPDLPPAPDTTPAGPDAAGDDTTGPGPGAMPPDGPGPLGIEAEELWAHLSALQDVATIHNGNRALGTPGYDGSVGYVTAQLEEAGYTVEVHPFALVESVGNAAPAFSQVSPNEASYSYNQDYTVLSFSGSGDSTAIATAVDLMFPPGDEPNSSTSGCEADDFEGFPDGHIALIQRGSCTFQEKVSNATNAGASAVIIFNEGQDGRKGLFEGTLDDQANNSIPVVGTTFAIGEGIADGEETTMRVALIVEQQEIPSVSLIASTEGDPTRTIVIGAHLDSVLQGPGINDNGSGVALVLEIARHLVSEGITPRNRIQFAFWGGEEVGLVGSEAFVDGLDDEALSQVFAYINFDMVASPNGGHFIYDGNGSHYEGVGPAGSEAIESLFIQWYKSMEIPQGPTILDDRSDHAPFALAGVPSGGLFTGAEESKSGFEVLYFGGEVGPYDSCYHQVCDNLDNINMDLMLPMVDAASYVLLTLADADDDGIFTLKATPTPGMKAPQAEGRPIGCHAHALRYYR